MVGDSAKDDVSIEYRLSYISIYCMLLAWYYWCATAGMCSRKVPPHLVIMVGDSAKDDVSTLCTVYIRKCTILLCIQYNGTLCNGRVGMKQQGL